MFNKNLWTTKDYKELIEYLKTNKDQKYKEFNQKLIPNIDKDRIIGIRIPTLKKLAKEISKGNYKEFLKLVKNEYYEETMLEALVIANLKNPDEIKNYLKEFIPKIDNWAICDTLCSSLKIINKNKSYFMSFIKEYLKNSKEYEIRFGLIIILNYYIEEDNLEYIFKTIDNLQSNFYYVNMGIAWLLSFCYIKYPNETLKYLKTAKLDIFTYNKTLQKIIESNRVTKENKEYLRKLKK